MAMTRQDVEDEALGEMQTLLEKELERMTDEQLGAWIDEKLVGYEPPELNLEVKPWNEAAAQFPPRMRYQTPQKLHAPIMVALRDKLKIGSLRLVKYKTSQWISPMFVKPKGRQDPITGLELLRFLTDFRAVNQELCWKAHWVDWMPTLEGMRVSIPRWARWFWPEDIKDAFEHVVVAEKDREKLTVAPPIRLDDGSFTEEEQRSWGYSDEEIEELQGADELLLQWQHAPQGLAPIAPFWNVYMAHGLSALFNEEFHKWTALFVDDILEYDYTKQHAADKQRIVSMALKKLGKRLSEKLDRTVRQEGHIAGMKFTPEGVAITDEAVGALVEAMGENVKSLKAAQRLVVILIYAQSSFQWDIDGQTVHAELLNVLHKAMSAPQFRWTDECKRAMEMLRERVKVAPRVACRPDELLNDGWCLVIRSGASNTGAGACLLLVKCEDDVG